MHVVASGIDEATFAVAVKARESVYDLVACLREAGVSHFLAHPLFDMDGKLTADIVEKCLLLFNVLEGRNGSRTTRCNGLLREIVATLTPARIDEMAERQGMAPFGATPWRKSLVGGSDDHSGLFVAGAHTACTCDGTVQGFFEAVAHGDCSHEGDDGDSRLLAHSIYAASFWRTREILRLDDETPRRRPLELLRKGFGRIGREVPVLEKTLRGVRSMAPGLYRDGDPRGPAWEALVDEKLGSLAGTKHGVSGVGSKDLNERLFTVISRLADDVQELHLESLLAPGPLPLKQFLQSSFAVGMVEFLELPYFIAWSFQSRDRAAQATLRDRFLDGGATGAGQGPALAASGGGALAAIAGADPLAVLTDAAPSGNGAAPTGWTPGDSGATRRIRILTPAAPDGALAQPGDVVTQPRGATARDELVSFRPLGELHAGGGTLRVPPLLDVLDDLEESGVEALHVTGPGPMGLAGLAGARLLHLPVSGACGAAHAKLVAPGPRRPGIEAPQARYLRAFYRHLDAIIVPDRPTARLLVAAGVDPSRVHIVPSLVLPRDVISQPTRDARNTPQG